MEIKFLQRKYGKKLKIKQKHIDIKKIIEIFCKFNLKVKCLIC